MAPFLHGKNPKKKDKRERQKQLDKALNDCLSASVNKNFKEVSQRFSRRNKKKFLKMLIEEFKTGDQAIRDALVEGYTEEYQKVVDQRSQGKKERDELRSAISAKNLEKVAHDAKGCELDQEIDSLKKKLADSEEEDRVLEKKEEKKLEKMIDVTMLNAAMTKRGDDMNAPTLFEWMLDDAGAKKAREKTGIHTKEDALDLLTFERAKKFVEVIEKLGLDRHEGYQGEDIEKVKQPTGVTKAMLIEFIIVALKLPSADPVAELLAYDTDVDSDDDEDEEGEETKPPASKRQKTS